MLIQETLREAMRSLWATKQRTLLALVGIIIGISSVIALVSIGLIIQKQTMDQFKEMGTEIVSITISSHRKGSAGLDLATLMRIPQACPDVEVIAPYVTISGSQYWKGKPVMGSGIGITKEIFSLAKLKLQSGRAITGLDAMTLYCVLSHEMSESITKQHLAAPLGGSLLFNGRYLTVVGILKEFNPSITTPYELTDGFLMPITSALHLNKDKGITCAMARITSGERWKLAEAQVRAFISLLYPDRNVKMRSAEELINSLQKQMNTFTIFLSAIGAIALVVGGVGVMNVMLVSVSERKKEIGIRRALGAKRNDIQFQFLIESVTLCCMGGIFGIIVGEAAAYVFAYINTWAFVFSYKAIALGFGVSTLVGVFFGFYPARKASQLKPVDALREA